MFQFTGDIVIQRPPQAVYEFVADLDNLPKWQTGVKCYQIKGDGPVSVGTLFDEEVHMGPFTVLANCEVTEIVPGKGFAFRGESRAMGYEGRFSFEPEGSGTRLKVQGDAWMHGVWRLMEPFARMDSKKNVALELERIRQNVEA